jgi:hypothetical protein
MVESCWRVARKSGVAEVRDGDGVRRALEYREIERALRSATGKLRELSALAPAAEPRAFSAINAAALKGGIKAAGVKQAREQREAKRTPAPVVHSASRAPAPPPSPSRRADHGAAAQALWWSTGLSRRARSSSRRRLSAKRRRGLSPRRHVLLRRRRTRLRGQSRSSSPRRASQRLSLLRCSCRHASLVTSRTSRTCARSRTSTLPTSSVLRGSR